MKEILNLTASLTLSCAIAGAALAYFNNLTTAPKAQAQIAQRTAKMRLVLPAETVATEEVKTADNGVIFFSAKDVNGKVIALFAQSSDDHGFGGNITILAGIDVQDGAISAIVVSENAETPGIGSNLCERTVKRSIWSIFSKEKAADTLPPNRYLDGYSGQKIPAEGQFTFAEKSAQGKIVPVSGATITSRAILNAVNKITDAWQQESPTISTN